MGQKCNFTQPNFAVFFFKASPTCNPNISLIKKKKKKKLPTPTFSITLFLSPSISKTKIKNFLTHFVCAHMLVLDGRKLKLEGGSGFYMDNPPSLLLNKNALLGFLFMSLSTPTNQPPPLCFLKTKKPTWNKHLFT